MFLEKHLLYKVLSCFDIHENEWLTLSIIASCINLILRPRRFLSQLDHLYLYKYMNFHPFRYWALQKLHHALIEVEGDTGPVINPWYRDEVIRLIFYTRLFIDNICEIQLKRTRYKQRNANSVSIINYHIWYGEEGGLI